MLRAGIARTDLTPRWSVELAGWGYYLERRWQAIADRLAATALVFEDAAGQRVALVTVDLMVIGRRFTGAVRQQVVDRCGIEPDAVLMTASHSHNAPAAWGLLGVGETDPAYAAWAAEQAAAAVCLATSRLEPVRLRTATTRVSNLSYNRTRDAGTVDDTLTVMAIDSQAGQPLATVVNYAAHPCVTTSWRPFAVSRDLPGLVCDRLEQAVGGTAMYVQGACGDVNVRDEFRTPRRYREPALKLAEAAIQALAAAGVDSGKRFDSGDRVAAVRRMAELPTRRWTREELEHDRNEALRRLESRDTRQWQETIGRAMTNRPQEMVARHGGDEWKAVEAMCRFQLAWTETMLRDFEHRPETLPAEVQALRVGDVVIVANGAELFSNFARELRSEFAEHPLVIACYANERIGYLPDVYDIERRSYAGYQSPKYCLQFPFVAESGPAMVAAMTTCVRSAMAM